MEQKKNKDKEIKGFSLERLKNMPKEEKVKYIAFGAGAVIFGLFMWWGTSNYSDENTQETTDFTTPQSEQEAYNNKLEAVNSNKTEQTTNDLGNTFAPIEESPTEEVDLKGLDRQLAGMNAGNSTQNPPPAQNSHDVYGDYNMWQSQEPTGSNIGYKNTRNRPRVVKERDIEMEAIPMESTSASSYSTTNSHKKSFSKKQVPAILVNSGDIEEGKVLIFAIKEPAKIGGVSLPKNYPIHGRATFQGDRVMVEFRAVNYNKKLYPVDITLVDSYGMEGLGISGGKERNTNIEDQAINEASSRIPVVGGIINSVKGNRNKKRSVAVNSAVNVFLLINE